MQFPPSISFRSIRINFALLVLIPLILIFSLSSGVLILRNINTQINTLVTQVRAYSKLTAKPIGDTYSLYYESGYLKFAELTNQILALNPDIKKVQIISVTGEILFDSDQLINTQKPETIAKEQDSQVVEKVKSNLRSESPSNGSNARPEQIIEPYFEDFGAHPFSVRYFVSYSSISENVFGTVTATMLLSLVFFVASIVLIISTVNKRILSPIEEVTRGAGKIRSGDLSYKIDVNTKDEVADLAAAVNQMAATLRKNIEDLKALDKLKDEFVFIASHNLRTPLTIIKGYTEKLLNEADLSVGAKKEIENMSQATGDLETITESLINLVALEKGKEPVLLSEVEITDLLRRTAEQFGEAASEKKISFIFEFPNQPLPKMRLDAGRISQAFANLIDNAIKFNKEGGKVIIKVEKNPKDVTVSIQDTGIGIRKEEQSKIFEKFHRATDTLRYDYEGVGLGLYLTRLIIQSHLGKIWIKSNLGEGTIFFVQLPFREV